MRRLKSAGMSASVTPPASQDANMAEESSQEIATQGVPQVEEEEEDSLEVQEPTCKRIRVAEVGCLRIIH